MISTKVLLVSALCLFGIVAAQETFKDCLQKDSISCVQLAVRQIMDYYKKKYWIKLKNNKKKNRKVLRLSGQQKVLN